MRTALRCLLVSFCFAVPTAVLAAPADLDPTFGDGGVASIAGAVTLDDGAMYPDGGLAVVINARRGGDNRALRLDSVGRVDPSFSAVRPQPATLGRQFIDAVAVTADGRTVTRQFVDWFPGCDVWLTRHLPSGAMDEAFGQSGVSRVFQGARCSIGPNLALSAAGEAYFSMFTGSIFSASANRSRVVRVGAAGTPGDQLVPTSQRSYGAIVVQGDGRPVVTLVELGAMRLFGAVPDPGFGTNGIAVANTIEVSQAHDVALAPDGRVVVAGIGNVGGVPQFVVTRFTNDGHVDLAFGAGGVAYVEAARTDERVISARVAVQPDGKIVVAGTVEKPLGSGVAFPRIAVGRLTVSGQPDPLFAPGGVSELWWQRGAGLSFLLIRPDGRIVIGAGILISFTGGQLQTEAAVVQLNGGDDSVARPLRERKAVEYFHASYGHYFLSSDPEEIAVLDSSPSSGWARTGRTINVWDDDDPALKPVCRFWSDQTWAPKSSHFYTPYEGECATVKAEPAWRFERNAFTLMMPEGALGSRTCPAVSAPLYRAYNNGQSGAPNHRYTTDQALLDAMIAQGWTMEGEAQTRVFACAPLQ